MTLTTMKTFNTLKWLRTLALTTLVLGGLTTGCVPGAVGGAETACDQAVDHLASCGITDLPDPGDCSATKQRLAVQILNRSCADMAERTSFSGASCSSVWSIFNPSCWGSSGGSGGPGQGKCHCDDECVTWHDCCAECGNGGSSGGNPPKSSSPIPIPPNTSKKCHCDNECDAFQDCCGYMSKAPVPKWVRTCGPTECTPGETKGDPSYNNHGESWAWSFVCSNEGYWVHKHYYGGGSFAGGGCFVAGTLIATPSGERAIETIRVGDEVLSYDAELGGLVVGKVTRTFVHPDAQTGTVTLGDGRVLQTTSNHPFFAAQATLSQSGQARPTLAIVEAGQLSMDDTVMVLDEVDLQRARVLEASFAGPITTVYNFTVDTHHTYFAGGVLVHNK